MIWSSSRVAIVMEITATDSAAARRMVSRISQHAGRVEELHARTICTVIQSLEKT